MSYTVKESLFNFLKTNEVALVLIPNAMIVAKKDTGREIVLLVIGVIDATNVDRKDIYKPNAPTLIVLVVDLAMEELGTLTGRKMLLLSLENRKLMLLNNHNSPLQLNNLQTVKVNHLHKLKVMPLKMVPSLNPMELKCNKPLKVVKMFRRSPWISVGVASES